MSMPAKVESYCLQHGSGTKSITIEGSERACINCIWYEPHYRENRGNIKAYIPVSSGYCLRREQNRGALRQPCKDYETKESPAN